MSKPNLPQQYQGRLRGHVGVSLRGLGDRSGDRQVMAPSTFNYMRFLLGADAFRASRQPLRPRRLDRRLRTQASRNHTYSQWMARQIYPRHQQRLLGFTSVSLHGSCVPSTDEMPPGEVLDQGFRGRQADEGRWHERAAEARRWRAVFDVP